MSQARAQSLKCHGRPVVGPAARAIIARSNDRKPRLVHADHDVARLDHRISGHAGGELEFVDGLVGDRRGDNGAADVDLHMRRGGALLHFRDFAFEAIARAELHESLLIAGANSALRTRDGRGCAVLPTTI